MLYKQQENFEEESKEDLDMNPFVHFRKSNIFEINGNI